MKHNLKKIIMYYNKQNIIYPDHTHTTLKTLFPILTSCITRTNIMSTIAYAFSTCKMYKLNEK